jgi:Skp family chaperone for outer membrane proteins
LLIAGALAALGGVFCIGRMWAQAPGADAAPTPKARIAVVNIAYLLKYSKKANDFNKEMQDIYKPFQDKEKELIATREAVTKEAQKLAPSEDAKRDELTKRHKDITRAIEDNTLAAKNELGKRSGQQLKILYGEIYDAARRYARAHDYDIVLQYADAFEPADMENPYLIERKLKTSPVLPLYMTPGVDISQQVVMMIGYVGAPSGGGAAPAGGGAPAGGDNK